MKLTSSCPYISAKWYRSGPRFIQTCHYLTKWANSILKNSRKCTNIFKELTPPSFKILDMISMYSTILCTVSIKKQVTTASQTPAYNINTLHKNHLQSKYNARILCAYDTMSSFLQIKVTSIRKEENKSHYLPISVAKIPAIICTMNT